MVDDRLDAVTVGRIERPFGVKGEVKVRSLSDVPGRWEALSRVSIVGTHGKTWETTVTHVRRSGLGFIIGLAGLTNPEEAGQWRGGLIQAPRTTATLPDGQYYECDLIGLSVQTETGSPLGVLEQVWELPAGHVFVVRDGAKEILVPAVKALVPAVDLHRRVLTVRMIEGMGE